jgi:hypothetical protein
MYAYQIAEFVRYQLAPRNPALQALYRKRLRELSSRPVSDRQLQSGLQELSTLSRDDWSLAT